jgi:hypothetical protein
MSYLALIITVCAHTKVDLLAEAVGLEGFSDSYVLGQYPNTISNTAFEYCTYLGLPVTRRCM